MIMHNKNIQIHKYIQISHLISLLSISSIMVKRQIFISVLFLNHRFKLGYGYGQIVGKKFNVIVAFVFVYLNIMYKKPK